MSSELSPRSSPSLFAPSPSGNHHHEASTATPLRGGQQQQAAAETSSSGGAKLRRRWRRGRRVLGAWAVDPRARWVREWDRAYLVACAAGLVVDPLFLYAVSVSEPLMCVFLDAWLAAAVTALRCALDAMHAWNFLTQLRLARAPPPPSSSSSADLLLEAAADGTGARSSDRMPPYARSRRKGMALDFFVALPVMQVYARVFAFAVGGLGGGAGDDPGGVDDGGDDGAACGVPAGVPPQDLPLRLLPPADAEPVGPHLRHHLVGHRAQPHGLLRRRPCGGRVLVPSRGAEGDQVPQGAVLPSPARVLVVRGGRRVRQPALLRRGRGDLHRRRRQAGLGQRRQGQEHVPWRRRRELPVRRLQVDRHAGGQHQPPREDAAPHLLGPHDPQHVREPGEHDGVAGDRVQHRDHHGRADPGDHADREHQGVPERDHVQEAGDAHAAAERGVVDEAQEPAAGLPAPGPAVRAPAVGGHPGRRRVPDRARPPRGAPPGHQVPPLPRPRPPGPALPAHGRPRPREHVRPRQIPHLPQRRNHCEGRGPGAEDAVHSAGAPGVQPDAAERGDEQLHAGAGELQRGRAAVVVPEEAIHGAAAAVVVHAGDHGEHGGVRAGRRRRQVRDAPLPLHIHQRQGAPQRALLLARVAHLGGGRRAARLEAVQAPQDAGVALLHQAPAAAVQVLLHGGGEAPALHRHPRLAQAQPRRRLLVVGLATPGSWISIGCQPMRAQKTRSMP